MKKHWIKAGDLTNSFSKDKLREFKESRKMSEWEFEFFMNIYGKDSLTEKQYNILSKLVHRLKIK